MQVKSAQSAYGQANPSIKKVTSSRVCVSPVKPFLGKWRAGGEQGEHDLPESGVSSSSSDLCLIFV